MNAMIKRAARDAIAVLLLAVAPALAQDAPTGTVQRPAPVQPKAFSSPEDGFAALAAAFSAHDEKGLIAILGEAGRRLVESGDPGADRDGRDRFTAAYAAGHEIVRPAEDRAVLQIGTDEWPLPIPMVAQGGVWRFDTRAGEQEIVDRRIGHNELDTIETLRAVADAQAEYAATAGRDGRFRTYARRFVSTQGAHDGLYWASGAGEPQSPLGPLVAEASAGGYRRSADGTPQPLHGYLFRMLDRQGPAAPGGSMEYVVNGRMIGGFAVVAWPVRYGSTGYKTFMISHDGTVWERDLGPQTAREAEAITAFDPGKGWSKVPE
jgi:hypothetical protein